MRYLTNIEPYDGLADDVKLAAHLSGFDIRYEPNPIPPEHAEYGDWGRQHWDEMSKLGCIVHHGPCGENNLSPFWRLFEQLQDARKCKVCGEFNGHILSCPSLGVDKRKIIEHEKLAGGNVLAFPLSKQGSKHNG